MSIVRFIDWQDGYVPSDQVVTNRSGALYGRPLLVYRDGAGHIYNPSKWEWNIAPGRGRHGRDAISIICKNSGFMPDFWIFAYERSNPTAGVSLGLCSMSSGFLAPRGKKVNRLHMWCKFQKGFQATSAAATQTGLATSNYQWGTYTHEPGSIPADGSSGGLSETRNQHGYHLFCIRHDEIDGDWVHIVIHEIPNHQRQYSQATPPKNWIAGYGGYWNSVPKMYFSPDPYGWDGPGTPFSTYPVGDSEIGAPFEMLLDSFYFEYVEENLPVEVKINGWNHGQQIEIDPLTSHTYTVTLRNTSESSVTGRLLYRSTSTAPVANVTFTLRIAGTGTNAHNTDVTLAPGETKTYDLTLTWTDTTQGANSGEAYRLRIYGASGTYKLNVQPAGSGIVSTASIPYNASSSVIRTALNDVAGPLFSYIVSGVYPQYRVQKTTDGGSWIKLTSTPSGGAYSQTEYIQPLAYEIHGGYAAGVTFTPSGEETNPRYGTVQVANKTDSRVAYRADTFGEYGPIDADVCGATVDLHLVDRVAPHLIPWTDGGWKWQCEKNQILTRQIPVSDPNGYPLTVALIDYESRAKVVDYSEPHVVSGGGTVTINSSGILQYTPTTDFEGTLAIRYSVRNPYHLQTLTCMGWIEVVPAPRIARLTGINNKMMFGPGGGVLTVTQ